MIAAHNVSFGYHGRRVLNDASLSLATGELVCLLGANGAGKSTLLKIMLGILKPQRGEVNLNGRPLAIQSRRQVAQRIAYVPQVHVAPFPYTVREVVLMGRLPATGFLRAASSTDHDKVQEIIQRIGIGHLADRPYTEVSGGERQLALIARALAQEASLLVMDEPLSGLDYGHQMRLLARLEQLAADGYGILMTTHDPDQSLVGCDRVTLLIGGRIAADGAPDEVLTPESIEQLYGVRVRLLRDPEGAAIAFRPHDRSRACSP